MPKVKRIRRQAVVIIHGIGEQRPMSTLRSFADAIPKIETNPSTGASWSKPDSISEGFEHHRFTLPQTRTRPITDVYELYWAHLFEQTNQSTFVAWIARLLFRPIPKLPRRFRSVVIALWLLLIGVIVGGSFLWTAHFSDHWETLLALIPILGFMYAGLVGIVQRFFLGTISDAARYLDATPKNVEARNKVRTLGVGFLARLHKSERNYDRIIVCGHSLGSVIGYDILQHFWYRMHETHSQLSDLDQSVQKRFSKYAKDGDGEAVRALQRDLWLEQVKMGNKWRITDFVTMGSPLAHADVLMADSDDKFEDALEGGELPACPPIVDPSTGLVGFKRDYQISGGGKRTIFLLRHSSMFAVTRWTNIYFKTVFKVFGDPIGGSVSRRFGTAVRDYEVKPKGWGVLFSHLAYWSGDRLEGREDKPPETALEALGDALEIDMKEIRDSGEDD